MPYKRIRTFNKYVINPLLRVFARGSRGPFAVIHHTGRRSGKPYETTIMVWSVEDGFVIALTYGESVDWYRNMQAAEYSTISWRKKTYEVGKPELIDARTALPAFPAFLRPILRRRMKYFARVGFIASQPATAEET